MPDGVGAGAEAAAASITVIHAAVPGRTRLRVAALRGDDRLARTVEGALPDGAAIRSARASAVTGTVLIDHACDLPAVTARVASVLAHGAAPPGEASTSEPAWHAMTAAEVLAATGSSQAGLTAAQANRRLAERGANIVPAPRPRSALEILGAQLRSSPTALLAAAAVLSLATGGVLDALAIVGVVVLNAGIGFAAECRTEQIVGSLHALGSATATLKRNGQPCQVPDAEVVPGDLMMLQAGTVPPADGRVIVASGLAVGESALSGESLPVTKAVAPVAADAPLAERSAMVYRGTAVVEGSGIAVAVATGARTEVGRIQAMLGEARAPETPMQRQLGRLGRQLVMASAAVCAGVFAIGLLRGQGLLAMLKGSVALAVAAIPEGLPTVATTVLALGVERMRRQRVLVRRLDAIETLAAVSVIAFDKTGTLTENRMTAAAVACAGGPMTVEDGRIRRADGAAASADPDLRRLLEIGILCSDATLGDDGRIDGSATEAALVRLGRDAGIDPGALRRAWPLGRTAHRGEARQYMTTRHDGGDGRCLLAAKGNPEQLLALCSARLRDGASEALDDAGRAAVLDANRHMAEQGLRVLGFAFADGAGTPDDLADLTWVGLVGLADPARQGAVELVRRFERARVRVIMLTGDQDRTAWAIARHLGLANGGPIPVARADQLRQATSPELRRLVGSARVFARVTPADKLRIVQALQADGHVVAMTGDGINDSPALRAADVGIALGPSGDEAAHTVADIVLGGDDLPAIATVLERGRTTYGNVRKAMRYLLATNLSEILVVLAATAAGAGVPLSPVQLLWLNLLTDVLPALGLGFEPAEPGVLDQPPRDPHEPIVRRADVPALGREAAVIAAGALAAFGYGRARHGASPRAGTVAFTSLVGAQLLHALSCRSERGSLFAGPRRPPNRPLTAALAGSAALQAAILLVPGLRRVMGLAALDLPDAAVGLAGAVLPYLVNEAAKPRL